MTNTKPRTFFYLLPLLMLACTLTTQETLMSATLLPERTATTHPTQTLTPAPLLCHVKTGIDAGALNMRACGGTDCPVLIVLHEGETLTQTEQEAVNGWMEIQTLSGLRGWLNSEFTDCPAVKAGLK